MIFYIFSDGIWSVAEEVLCGLVICFSFRFVEAKQLTTIHKKLNLKDKFIFLNAIALGPGSEQHLMGLQKCYEGQIHLGPRNASCMQPSALQ